MSFKKIVPQLKENLETIGIENLNEYQATLFPKFKSGAPIFAIAPENSGKTTTLILHIAQKLMKREVNFDIPRAVVVVADNDAALAFEEQLRPFIFRSQLRTYIVNENYDMTNQRHDLFDGTDIVITTAPRFQQLFLNNGINLAELEIMAIEDADQVLMEHYRYFIRISESLTKCQYIVIAQEMSKKVKTLEHSFMDRAETVFGESNPPIQE